MIAFRHKDFRGRTRYVSFSYKDYKGRTRYRPLRRSHLRTYRRKGLFGVAVVLFGLIVSWGAEEWGKTPAEDYRWHGLQLYLWPRFHATEGESVWSHSYGVTFSKLY